MDKGNYLLLDKILWKFSKHIDSISNFGNASIFKQKNSLFLFSFSNLQLPSSSQRRIEKDQGNTVYFELFDAFHFALLTLNKTVS